jgi:hypothetical protein
LIALLSLELSENVCAKFKGVNKRLSKSERWSLVFIPALGRLSPLELLCEDVRSNNAKLYAVLSLPISENIPILIFFVTRFFSFFLHSLPVSLLCQQSALVQNFWE